VSFVLTTALMMALAQNVARSFARFAPLEAYRLDILGSLAGIVAFSAISFLSLPPAAWGVVAVLLVVVLRWPRPSVVTLLAGAAVVALLVVESLSPTDTWSPYYRITVNPIEANGLIGIEANGIPHQAIRPLSLLRAPGSFYVIPYQHLNDNPLGRVLIIGAGTGNDVAVALSEGAKHVDAVEIDPVLHRIGEEQNPSHPYQDPRVTVHVDDGRAFLDRTNERFDLILFALPDSLTLLPGQSTIRLESFLLTIDSLREAASHLAPGGAFAMYNYYRAFEYQRLGRSLTDVYGRRPCVGFGRVKADKRQAVLEEGESAAAVTCERTFVPDPNLAPAPATDDHPFPYLATPSIPSFYLWSLAFILLASVLAVRGAAGAFGRMSGSVDLFFMGAAFLLLETKSIVQFALLFGTTWFVNALVFAGVLLSVLAAIEVARRVRARRPWLFYAALLAALAVSWLVPPDDLLRLSVVPRFLVAVALAFAPIFLANLVFAERFRDVATPTTAFGANLLGAMLGGALEYLALITGYRFLIIVVAALYALAFLFGRGMPWGGRSVGRAADGDR
jgi:hypothetical protein